jgi:hypothetical protein
VWRAAPQQMHCTCSAGEKSSFNSRRRSSRTDRARDDVRPCAGARRSEGASGARWPRGQAQAGCGLPGVVPAQAALGLTLLSFTSRGTESICRIEATDRLARPTSPLRGPKRYLFGAMQQRIALPFPVPAYQWLDMDGVSGLRRPSPERERARGAPPPRLAPDVTGNGQRPRQGSVAAGAAAAPAFPPRPPLRFPTWDEWAPMQARSHPVSGPR